MSADLQNPIFTDEARAREWLEARIWPNGPVCPHCGAVSERVTKLEGDTHRPGLYQCNECREQFTATVGTLFERSKIPLRKWLMALYLMMASKKGMSSHQMSRMLDVSYKSTWFMTHRLREALREGKFPIPMGGHGKTVEMDETYVGGKTKNKHRADRHANEQSLKTKEAVISLVERGGKVRSHHVPGVTARNVGKILKAQLKEGTQIYTDELRVYKHVHPIRHRPTATVNHSAGEYVRGDVHTNTIEGYFSILKRGITGTFHHVSEQHLKRYLCEFDFRYNERAALGVSDMARTEKAIKGIVGKRLTYRRTGLSS